MSGVTVATMIRSISEADDASLIHGILCRSGRHVAGMFTLCGDPALLDSGAGGDPVVARLDDFFEICVGEYPLGHVAAGSND